MSSSIRLQLRTLANHLPSLSHQSGNILLLLPILVFLSLYLYNAHLAGRIKTKEGYEQVVWPGQFGFPQWYSDPRGRELVPWVDETQEEGKQPVRLLGILRESACVLLPCFQSANQGKTQPQGSHSMNRLFSYIISPT